MLNSINMTQIKRSLTPIKITKTLRLGRNGALMPLEMALFEWRAIRVYGKLNKRHLRCDNEQQPNYSGWVDKWMAGFDGQCTTINFGNMIIWFKQITDPKIVEKWAKNINACRSAYFRSIEHRNINLIILMVADCDFFFKFCFNFLLADNLFDIDRSSIKVTANHWLKWTNRRKQKASNQRIKLNVTDLKYY